MATGSTILLCFGVWLASIAFSMMGQGGGAIYTPLQVWLGVDFHVAATTSLFLIMVTSFSATLTYHNAQQIDWPLALVLEGVTMIGGFSGGYYSALFSGALLSLIFAIVISLIAALMILDPARFKKERPQLQERGYIWKRELHGQTYHVHLPLAMAACFCAGAFSGLLGIGGGILKVPLMVLLLSVPVEIAVGTSGFMVGLTALAGFSGHLLQGHWDWKMSLILAVIVFIGGQIGSRISVGIEKATLRKGCGWLLLFVALTTLLQIIFT